MASLTFLGCSTSDDEAADTASGAGHDHSEMVQPGAPAQTKTLHSGETVPEAGQASGERKILYWRAPMDPTYIRNEPGKSPMGMDLVPVYKEDVAGGPTILIDPVTEQNMGLRYDVVRMGPLEKTVRTVGTIEYNEQSLGTVTTKIDGWVEKVYVNETGTQVHEGDALFEFYSPQLFSTQEEYLVALRDFQRTGNAVARDLAESRLQSARDRLRFYDISDPQIERLEREGKINKTLTVTAGLTGIVTHRNVTEGDSLKAGQSAYKIADLSTIWAIGKVYESDLPYIRLGQEAQMRLAYLPGRSYSGRVTYVYPYLQPGTREIPVRMEFHNPGYLLKPGMYATLELHTRLEEKAVLVPSMAVIDTGERQVVFVRREAGKFEPRRIKVGLRTSENELQVLSGLAPGEQIVVSGQFLIDSESRLREATLKMLNPGSTNTTDLLESEGAQHDPTTDGSMTVMTDSEAGPLRYVCPMLGHAGILYDQPGDCPLCGMNLVPVHSTTDGEAASRISHYTCPMPEHYSVREEQPGKCPLCSMTMIPVTQQESERFTQAAVKGLPPQLYTCPIPSHAEVVSDQPIRCPHCGRTLVPTEAVPHGAEAESRWRITQSSDSGTTSPLPLYTCPMENHAHVVSAEAGRCPECNMALVPTSEVAHGEQAEAAWREREPQP